MTYSHIGLSDALASMNDLIISDKIAWIFFCAYNNLSLEDLQAFVS